MIYNDGSTSLYWMELPLNFKKGGEAWTSFVITCGHCWQKRSMSQPHCRNRDLRLFISSIAQAVRYIVATIAYGFDAAERLIVVEHMHCSKEYILYDTGVTLGVEIDNANNASAVNICRYDVNGRIQIYECYFLTPKADQVFYMTRETFRYLPDQVIDNWYREMEYEGEWFHEHYRYVFSVEDGYLTDYTAERFYHGRRGVKVPYRVTKKRKVPPCTPENR